MADASLILVLDEVRRKTLALLDGVTDEQARWAPRGMQNTILWHAGHCYILLEWLTMQSLGRQPQAPEGWFEMFSWDSRPASIPPDRWPDLAEVVERLGAQLPRMRDTLSDLTEEQLTQPAIGRTHRSVRYHILHALHDEACHSGEIWLLRKMQRAGAGKTHD